MLEYCLQIIWKSSGIFVRPIEMGNSFFEVLSVLRFEFQHLGFHNLTHFSSVLSAAWELPFMRRFPLRNCFYKNHKIRHVRKRSLIFLRRKFGNVEIICEFFQQLKGFLDAQSPIEEFPFWLALYNAVASSLQNKLTIESICLN